VPTVFITLLNLDLSGYDLSSIRYEFSAAATMPQEISRRWTERFGRPVYEGYGLTECSPFACYNHDFRHKVGSVGTAVENTELKIVDPDDQPLPPGEWGEIVIRGPGVMKGYWKKPEDTAQALRNGWLHSGDIGGSTSTVAKTAARAGLRWRSTGITGPTTRRCESSARGSSRRCPGWAMVTRCSS